MVAAAAASSAVPKSIISIVYRFFSLRSPTSQRSRARCSPYSVCRDHFFTRFVVVHVLSHRRSPPRAFFVFARYTGTTVQQLAVAGPLPPPPRRCVWITANDEQAKQRVGKVIAGRKKNTTYTKKNHPVETTKKTCWKTGCYAWYLYTLCKWCFMGS